MKNFGVALFLSIASMASAASADDLTGRVGITAEAGFGFSGNGQSAGTVSHHTTNGFTGGGGIIYGISPNLAATAEANYARVETGDGLGGRFECIDTSLSIQYRFRPSTRYVPFVGIGADVFMPTLLQGGRSYGASTVFGGHLKGGIDVFMSDNFAFTTEAKATMGPQAKVAGINDRYDPSTVSLLLGYRIFF
jgi:outer membrane protein